MTKAVAKRKPKAHDELLEALAACTPRQKELLEKLPLFGGSPWKAAAALGIGTATVSRWSREARFRRARALFDEITIDAHGINTSEILAETALIAFAKPRQVFDEKGNLKPLNEWDEANAATIDGIEVEDLFEADGEGGRTHIGYTRKIKRTAGGKLRALELLGKHKRLWGEDKPVPPPPEGPGLTVIVQQQIAANGPGAQVAARVVVNLSPPEK